MVKIPSFARRDESADAAERRATTDTDTTEVRDGTDAGSAPVRERPTMWGRWSDRDRGRAAVPPPTSTLDRGDSPNTPTEAERRLARTDLSGDRPSPPLTEARPETHPEAQPELAPDALPAGPRPRTSVMATLSLIFAIGGAFLVLSGALAGYGIAAGAIGVLLSVFAFSATRKRHVAGKLDAMLGLLIGGAAVVIGVLAFTGTFAWPNTDGDWVERLRGWLDSQFWDRF